MTRFVAAALVVFVLGAGTSEAQGIRKEPVRFAPGASSATIKGTIKGDQDVDYVLGAKAGQKLTVTLKSRARTTPRGRR